MPTARLHTIAPAAKMVGVPPNTLRNWMRTYSKHLSAESHPPPGVEKLLTDRDIAVLKLVAQMRVERVPPADVMARLDATTVTAAEVISEVTTPPTSDEERRPDDAQTPPNTFQPPALVLDDLVSRVARLETSTSQAQARQLRQAVIWFAAGVVVALVCVVVAALVLSVMR